MKKQPEPFNNVEPVSADRQRLILRIRQQIAAGTYETPAKIDVAVDGLANDLG